MIIFFLLFLGVTVFHLIVNIIIKMEGKNRPYINNSFIFFLNIFSLVLSMISATILAFYAIVLSPQPAKETKLFQDEQRETQKNNTEAITEINTNVENIKLDVKDIKDYVVILPENEPTSYSDDERLQKTLDMIFNYNNTALLTNGNTAKYTYTIISPIALNSRPEDNFYPMGKGSVIYGYEVESLNCKNYVPYYVYDIYEEE